MSAAVALTSDVDDTPSFDLDAFIRAAAQANPELSGLELTWKVIRDMDDRQRRLALARLMPNYVDWFIPKAAAESVVRQTATTPQRVAQAWYEQAMAKRIFTGTGYKYLADCTPDDLHRAAAARYKSASAIKTEADRLVAVADYLTENELRRVGQVTAPQLEEILSKDQWAAIR